MGSCLLQFITCFEVWVSHELAGDARVLLHFTSETVNLHLFRWLINDDASLLLMMVVHGSFVPVSQTLPDLQALLNCSICPHGLIENLL